MGLLPPSVFYGKYIMQLIWCRDLSWECPWPSEFADRWYVFITQLPALSNIRIPRYFGTCPKSPIELWGFYDTSNEVMRRRFTFGFQFISALPFIIKALRRIISLILIYPFLVVILLVVRSHNCGHLFTIRVLFVWLFGSKMPECEITKNILFY